MFARQFTAHALSIFTLLIFCIALPNASAQRFVSLTPRLNAKQAKVLERIINQALKTPAAYQAAEKDIESYFMKYKFPTMTSYTPEALGELGKEREKLIKIIRGTSVKAAQDKLTALSLKAGISISRTNFHPAVRYNAALIVGLLDKEYSANNQPPTPLPEGTLALIELLEKDAFTNKQGKDTKVPASVKTAALVGLERHARFGISAEYTDRVTKAALAVIANTEPEEEISEEFGGTRA